MYLPSEHLYHVKFGESVMWPWLPLHHNTLSYRQSEKELVSFVRREHLLFSRPVCRVPVIPSVWSMVIAPSWLHSMC